LLLSCKRGKSTGALSDGQKAGYSGREETKLAQIVFWSEIKIEIVEGRDEIYWLKLS
jgi:hypothetical protein